VSARLRPPMPAPAIRTGEGIIGIARVIGRPWRIRTADQRIKRRLAGRLWPSAEVRRLDTLSRFSLFPEGN
ncbi:MAG: hypothetical protein AB7R40_24345, partial [Nitrospiraceae bacterium]